MIRRIRALVVAVCVAALLATPAAAQSGKIEDDLQRAQDIVNLLATGAADQGTRDSLEAELAGIEAHEYVVPVKLTARKYAGGSGYYPVTVSKPGLLDAPLVGRIEMPKGVARRAKSKLSSAFGTLGVEVSPGSTATVLRTLWGM